MNRAIGFAVTCGFCSSLIMLGCIRPPVSSESDTGTILRGHRVEISVESAGDGLPIIPQNGDNWIPATSDETYQIVLHNPGPGRIEVVVSVDGLNVISGTAADYRTQRGYVLDEGETLAIPGFRTGLETVAAFQFSPSRESLAARRGGEENVGLIGVAVFMEVAVETPAFIADRHEEPEAVADANGRILSTGGSRLGEPTIDKAAESAAPEPGQQSGPLGTNPGATINAPAKMIPFVRRDVENPDEILLLRYDDGESLRARGIL